MINDIDYSLYLITDTDICPREKLLDVCMEAFEGGVTLLQLREKDISYDDFVSEARELKVLCEKYGVPLIINDNIDVAVAVDADGVHIGQEDCPLSEARKILGGDKIIGVSAGNVDEALAAEAGGADYIGVGAVFPTSTKKDAENIGLDMLRSVRKSVKLPIVAIGGINENNIARLSGTDIEGVAVVSCIMGSETPRKTSRALKSACEKFKSDK